MNKLNKKSIFVIVGLVLVLAISLVLPLGTAFADYQNDVVNNPNAIINYNQLIKSDYVNFKTSMTALTNIDITDDYSLHYNNKFYIRYIGQFSGGYACEINITDYSLGNVNTKTLNASNSFSEFIFNSTNNCKIRAYTNGSNTKLNCMCVNLTQMFGENNEPSLNECQEIFVASYYPYSTGNVITYNTLDSYMNGFNDGIGSLDVVFEGTLLANNIFGVNCDVATATDIGLDFSVGNANRQANDFSIFGFNFPSTLVANDTINLYIDGLAIWSDTSYKHLEIGYYENGVFSTFADINLSNYNSATFLNTFLLYSNINTSINLNRSLNTLYFKIYGRSNNAFGAFQGVKITANTKNLDFAISDAYQQGYDYAKQFYDNYYSPNGLGYQTIYNRGYYAYPTEDHFTFQKLIYSVIDVPVQAFTNLFDYDILGVNMKTFYLSLFTLAVIVTILRLVL